MGLTKYKGFIAGQPLPAENVNSIDPENVDPQAAGYLTGGTGHSLLAVFSALGSGANDGKIKINLDGTVYDNVDIPLSVPSLITTGTGYATATGVYGANYHCQSLTVPTGGGVLSSIQFYGTKYGSGGANQICDIYASDANDKPTGSVLASVSVAASTFGSTGWQTAMTGFNVFLSAGKYVAVFRNSGGDASNYIEFGGTSSSEYAGGKKSTSTNSGSTWTNLDSDMMLKISFSALSLSSIASTIQSAIRAASGTSATVAYSTDHFVFTSGITGRTSQVLKLMTPSTGTDISGAGATPYLDCAANATETLGTGEEFNLVRLDENGAIPSSLIGGSRVFVKAGSYSLTTAHATVIYPTEVLDTGSEYNTSTGIFTASKAGYYHISTNTGKQRNGFNTAILKVVKNIAGTPEILMGCIAGASDGGSGASSSCSGVFYLTTGSTICVQMRQQTWAGAVEDNGEGTFPFLSIIKL